MIKATQQSFSDSFKEELIVATKWAGFNSDWDLEYINLDVESLQNSYYADTFFECYKDLSTKPAFVTILCEKSKRFHTIEFIKQVKNNSHVSITE